MKHLGLFLSPTSWSSADSRRVRAMFRDSIESNDVWLALSSAH